VETGAEVILTECNSCVHNLANAKSRYSKLRKQKVEIHNTTVFINQLLEAADQEGQSNS
jgi:heterodisulfide reductase subunit D